MVLPALLDQSLDGEEVAHEAVVDHRPNGRVVRQRHLVVGEGAEDLGRRHHENVADPGRRRGERQRPTGAQQRRATVGGPADQRLGEVGARGDPHQDVDPGELGRHPWPVGVDHPPAGALDHAAYRREYAYLRDSVLLAARGREQPGDPQGRHPDDVTRSGDGHHGHTRPRRFALGGTDAGTQRVLLVVV